MVEKQKLKHRPVWKSAFNLSLIIFDSLLIPATDSNPGSRTTQPEPSSLTAPGTLPAPREQPTGNAAVPVRLPAKAGHQLDRPQSKIAVMTGRGLTARTMMRPRPRSMLAPTRALSVLVARESLRVRVCVFQKAIRM